jgi:hypothetical protein
VQVETLPPRRQPGRGIDHGFSTDSDSQLSSKSGLRVLLGYLNKYENNNLCFIVSSKVRLVTMLSPLVTRRNESGRGLILGQSLTAEW